MRDLPSAPSGRIQDYMYLVGSTLFGHYLVILDTFTLGNMNFEMYKVKSKVQMLRVIKGAIFLKNRFLFSKKDLIN